MANYMPQQLFNLCAVSAAKIAASQGHPIEAISSQLASSYVRFYEDKSLKDEISEAARKVTELIKAALPPETIVGNLTQIQFCIKGYQTNGRKWPFKILRGALFNRMKEPIPDKVEQCIRDITAYHVLTISGTIPLAPGGWHV